MITPDERFQQQWLGHIVIKFFAMVVNICAFIMAILSWEFGDQWDKLIFHATLGMLPVHLMTLMCVLIASKQSREVSILQDYLCMAICLSTAFLLFFITTCYNELALFLLITGSLHFFDLLVHIITEDKESVQM